MEQLAREAELCYATLAMATDYDVWHDTHAAVSVDVVVKTLLQNVATAKDVLARAIPDIAPPRACECSDLLKNAIITDERVTASGAFTLTPRKRFEPRRRIYIAFTRTSPGSVCSTPAMASAS